MPPRSTDRASLRKGFDPHVSASPTPRVPSTLWRVFCAIEVPHILSARMVAHINALRQSCPNVRASWNRDGKFHLTLKFVGEIPQTRVEDLSHAAEIATHAASSFKLSVEGAGVFPQSGPPNVLWIGIRDIEGALDELHSRLESECEKAGFARERRPLHPHLTLARLRTTQGARDLGAAHCDKGFAPAEINVSELLVIRSELSSEGSRYTVISRHAFTGNAYAGSRLTGSAGVPPA